jgi:exopolyphosphatase/guanosine-5'-triphosphate,3'-diphosphate pyrophosphatase
MPRYAAIDIGSNSIRMLASELDAQGAPRTLVADRKVVRLGATVFREGWLAPREIELACETLAQMAEQLRKLEVGAMRAVATAAVRDAANRDEFLEPASRILASPIEVISGLEEARLVHLGVQSLWPHPKERLAILDIGGGSAELILADRGQFIDAYSKPLGAMRLTGMFLKSDPPDPRELARMQRYIQERIAGAAAHMTQGRLRRMIATSATAAAAVCAINNIPRSRRDRADRLAATAPQIAQLYRDVSGRNVAERAKMTGIGPKRAEIIVPGVAVLYEVMQALNISQLHYSAAGVRDGIIADLIHGKAARERSRLDPDQRRAVRALARRYGTATPHSRKVAELAGMLFHELRTLHRLPPDRGRWLEAAAHLYNIGHYVNEARHHRHSMYLVANSDLPGFDDRERLVIANLCRYHRKSMPQSSHQDFAALGPEERRAILFLAPLLRLAIALDQSQQQKVERVEAQIQETAVELWLSSRCDLDIEQWHAQQLSDLFQSVYGVQLSVKARK